MPRESTQGPAVLARTTVTSSHAGQLVAAGHRSRPVGYLDNDGEPTMIVARADLARLPQRAYLHVETDSGRRVVLGGRLRIVGDPNPALTELLAAHGSCFADDLHSITLGLVRLIVATVCLDSGGDVHTVPVTDYRNAHPDLWAAFGGPTTRHLQADHPDLLDRLASAYVPDRPLVAVSLRALRPSGLGLDVITEHGAHRVEIPFIVSIPDPRGLCAHLLDLVTFSDRHR